MYVYIYIYIYIGVGGLYSGSGYNVVDIILCSGYDFED